MNEPDYLKLLGPEPEWQACAECGENWAPSILSPEGLCMKCYLEANPESKPDDRLTEAELAALICKIPRRHHPACRIELPDSVSAWDPEKEWAVIFHGPNGAGKTWLATRAWMHAAMKMRARDAEWVSCKAFAAELREAVRTETPSPARRLIQCSLLLLDDLRAVERNDGRATAFIADELEHVITQRDDWMRPTILTMDKPISGLGPRLESRLSAPYALPIVLSGSDRRKEPR